MNTMATYMARISSRMCTSSVVKWRSILQPKTAAYIKTQHCSYCSRVLKADNDRVIAMTSDESTIVCYHPTEAFPYQHTKPMPRPDPAKPEQGVDSMLKMKMRYKTFDHEQHGPSIKELSRMFYTTKHRWFPVGIRRLLRTQLKDPPRDRPYL